MPIISEPSLSVRFFVIISSIDDLFKPILLRVLGVLGISAILLLILDLEILKIFADVDKISLNTDTLLSLIGFVHDLFDFLESSGIIQLSIIGCFYFLLGENRRVFQIPHDVNIDFIIFIDYFGDLFTRIAILFLFTFCFALLT